MADVVGVIVDTASIRQVLDEYLEFRASRFRKMFVDARARATTDQISIRFAESPLHALVEHETHSSGRRGSLLRSRCADAAGGGHVGRDDVNVEALAAPFASKPGTTRRVDRPSFPSPSLARSPSHPRKFISAISGRVWDDDGGDGGAG